jgi:hypothetical protein
MTDSIMCINTMTESLLYGYTPSILLSATALLLIIWQYLFKLDPREPPLLNPQIPMVGHVIGIIRHNISYFDKIL